MNEGDARALRGATGAFALRAHLILYGLVVAVPLFIALGVFIIRDVSEEREKLDARMLQAATALAAAVDREIDRRRAVLETLATSPALEAADWPAFYAQAKAAVGTEAGVIVLDASMRQIVNTFVPLGTAPPITGDPPTAKRVLTTKESETSNLFMGIVTKQPAFNITLPILHNQEVRYILLLALEPNDLLPILQSEGPSPGWISSLFDGNDVVIARSQDHERFVGTQLPERLSSSSLKPGQVIQTTNLDGDEVLSSAASSRSSSWRITVNVPVEVVWAPFWQKLSVAGATALGALAIAVTGGFILARLVARPIVAASAAARALGQNLPVPPRGAFSNVKEANELHDALMFAEKELRQREERQRLLIGELNHRAKNLLAIVEAIITQTKRVTQDPDAFSQAVSARLSALASAHNLLTSHSWRDATLGKIVEAALTPFKDRSSQFAIEGRETSVPQGATVTLILMIHELATNAAKYGALSTPSGRVALKWLVSDAGAVTFSWCERGGPAVAPPNRRGFGTRLLETGALQLGATVDTHYATDGFTCRLVFPIFAPNRPPENEMIAQSSTVSFG
jgi:two-component sensor histidine kinase